MRRLLLINYEYPPLGGGGGNATYHLARGFAKLGAEVKVLTALQGELPSHEKTDGVEVHRIPAWRKRPDRSDVPEMLAFMMAGIRSGVPLARTWQPDAMLAFFGLPCGPIARAIQKKTGIRYLISLQGGDVPGFLPRQLKLWHAMTGRWITSLWSHADHVVANSDGLASLARAHAPGQTIDVIPAGVDLEAFTPPGARDTDGPLKIIAAGRLSEQKRFDRLLNAAAALPDKTQLHITFLGDGPLRGQLAGQAERLGLGRQVTFRGWLDRSEMADAYRSAEVFVLPSSDEGMSNAMLEAMAAGLCVVGTDVAGTNEAVIDGGTGYLIPVDDTGALTGALRTLIGDRAHCHALGAAGRKRVEEHFGWDRAAEAYFKLMGLA